MASAALPVSGRSRSSGSSASSLSSAFSDITSATDVSASSSPPGAKTNAFFASPFNTRPPSPPRSLTADFFATPLRPPSPPASTSPRRHTPHSQFHPSRIFPSRYTSTVETSARSPEFSLLNLDDLAPHAYHPLPDSYRPHAHARTPSDGSDDSIALASPSSSIFGRPRLPTPPPPPTPSQHQHLHHRMLHREDTIVPSRSRPDDEHVAPDRNDELTPRPAPREPPMLHFERSLLLARQAEAQAETQKRLHLPDDPPVNPNLDREEEEEEEEEEELKEGSIISLPPTAAMASFAYGGTTGTGMSPPPVRAAPLPISPLALTFTLSSDTASQSPPGTHDRGTTTPTPMGDPSGPSGALQSGRRSPDLPGAAAFSPYLHPQSGSHPPAATSSLPSPLPSSSPSLSRSPSGAALALSTSSSSSSISQGYAYTHQATHTSSPTSSLPPQTQTPAPQLRLLRPLGHGAFSAVWLAEDLSRVPLTLVSKKSVRDLRRRASGRDGGEREMDTLRERSRENDRIRRARDKEREREAARTPEPAHTPRDELDPRTSGLNDTPRPPAARPPASISRLIEPVPLHTPPASAFAVSIAPSVTAPLPPATAVPASTVATKSPHRQSSRLREGLRSMLAFSRGAGAALASAGSHPHPHWNLNANANADTSVGASPHANDNNIPRPLIVHSPRSSSGSSATTTASAVSVNHSKAMDVDGDVKAAFADAHHKGHAEHLEHADTEADMSIDVRIDSPVSPISPVSPVSRASSIRSSEGAVSIMQPSLSRASSVSVRLVDEHHTDDDDINANAALLRDASLRKFRARVRGTRPALRLASGRVCLDERDGEMGVRVLRPRPPRVGDSTAGDSEEGDTDGEDLLRASLTRKPSAPYASAGGMKAAGRLVAVKMTARRAPPVPSPANPNAHISGSSSRRERERERIRLQERQRRREEEERTRVRFVREVEVLKHISHPNITPLLAHLSTATHHILVLPYLPGGDLLGLVNNDIAWGKLSESVLRRIWFELCKAVGWMHGVGLVHRDIKLENILLTTPTFSTLVPDAPPPTLASLPVTPAPFIKLTDFGLSRFVELNSNGDAEPLSTRCGSEAYAAPELVTGGGVYDARKTDAWACGVVLYALVGRVLPFGESAGPAGDQGLRGHSKIGGERGEERRGATPVERRHWLMRIARGEWTWPGAEDEEQQQAMAPVPEQAGLGDELVGVRLVQSQGARRIVNRLLVRDTRKRARIADLWDDTWMRVGGEDEEDLWWRGRERDVGKADTTMSPSQRGTADVEMLNPQTSDEASASAQTWDGDAPEFWRDTVDVGFYDASTGLDGLSEDAAGREGDEEGAVEGEGDEGEEELEEEELEEEEDGCLFDQEGIDSITRQEVI